MKARVGSRDVSASLALKTWWDPAATVCVTGAYDRLRQDAAVGLFVSLEKGGAVEYRKAVEGAQAPAPNLPLRAQPHLNAKLAPRMEQEPFAPPPPGGLDSDFEDGRSGWGPKNRFL